MSEPTLRLTFNDLILRTAEFLGIADYTSSVAGIPTDAHDLDLCKRLVNDGYREFIRAKSNWQFLSVLLTVTFDPTGLSSGNVASDPSRYYLPDGFYGALVAPWTYPSTGPRIRIEEIHEGRIRELLAGASYTGQPRLVAMRPVPQTNTSSGKRWEAIFYPAPSAVYTVTARGRTFPDALTTLTDVPVGGFEHDETILALSLKQAERQRNDNVGIQAQHASDMLQHSVDLDKEATPRRLGDYGDTSDDRLGTNGRRPLSFYSVDTYNGNSV